MLFNSHLDPADHHPAMNLSPLDEVVERGAVGELQACLGHPSALAPFQVSTPAVGQRQLWLPTQMPPGDLSRQEGQHSRCD